MTRRKNRWISLASTAAALLAFVALAAATPAAAQLDEALDLLLTEEPLVAKAFADGADPAELTLRSGGTLADFLLRTATGTGQVYFSVPPCRVQLTTASQLGKMLAGEVRGFDVRGAIDLSIQGGPATGCGVPDTANAIAISFRTFAPGGSGNLWARPSNMGGFQLLSGYPTDGDTFSIVPLSHPTGADDFDLRTTTSAAHITSRVVGYFEDLVLTLADADTVDGFDASATATPGELLALDGAGKLPADITGNAATADAATTAMTADAATTAMTADAATTAMTADVATALAADGSDCAAGEVPTGVDAAGNAQGCAPPPPPGNIHEVVPGDENTKTGFGALTNNTTGYGNTANGAGALTTNTTAYWNTAVGGRALRLNDGRRNTAIGARALEFNTMGITNTASGYVASFLNTTGSYNAGFGYGSLLFNETGDWNAALGARAGFNNTGSRNVFVGAFAGSQATSGTYNVFIANSGAATDTNLIKIGDALKQTKTYVAGIRGVTTGVGNGIAVLIDSAGQLGTVSSSRRYKEDIDDMAEASARLLELRPVTFRYKKEFSDGEKPIQFGLIAEEVAEIFPELVVYNEAGEPETVKYHLLSSLLLNELQKQASLNLEQARWINAQDQKMTRLAALEDRLAELEDVKARLARVEASGRQPPRVAAVVDRGAPEPHRGTGKR